jgi:tRNA U34 5-carboxymethylaminomethyl modifying GTPase MnmE/TrmE
MNSGEVSAEAATLGRRMFDSLRASDMRYEGAHLLAEYIVQAGRMFQASQVAAQDNERLVLALAEQREQIEELATVTPHMLSNAEKRLQEATERHVASMQAASQLQFQTLKAALEELRQEQAQLQASRAAADIQQNEIRLAREHLERERRSFNSMPLWRRILART